MKRLWLLLLLACSFQFVHAQPNIVVSVGNTAACAGDTILVPVQSTGTNGVAAISLALEYNTQNLIFDGFTGASAQISNGLLVNATGGKVMASWFSVNPINLAAGDLFSIRFVVSGASPLNWDLATPGNCEIADINGDPISAGFTSGGIAVTGPEITTQPSGPLNLQVGDDANLTVSATGALAYQWQQLIGGNWTNLTSGAIFNAVDQATLGIFNVPLSLNGAEIRVLVFGNCPQPVASNSVTINVTGGSTGAVISIPANVTACAGDTILVPVSSNAINGVAAISLALNYNDQNLIYDGFEGAATNISSSLLVNATGGKVLASWFSVNPINLTGGQLFAIRFIVNGASSLNWDLATPGNCEIADINGDPIPTTFNGGNLNVQGGQITAQPSGNTSITEGGSTNFTVGVSGATAVQWEMNVFGLWADVVDDANFSGATTTTLQINNAPLNFDGLMFRLRILSNCQNTVRSNSITLNVSPASTAASITAGSASGCIGDTILIPISSSVINGVAAISLALNYDTTALMYDGFVGAAANISNALLVNASGGKVLASWFSVNPINLTGGQLFAIRFIVNGASSLNWDLATPGNCEIADINGDPLQVSFNNGNTNLSGGQITQQPSGNNQIQQGGSTSFTAAASNAVSYRWQALVNGAYVDLFDDNVFSGTGTPTIQINNPPLTFNTAFRVKVDVGCASPVFSNSITLFITALPGADIITYLSAGPACSGDTLSVDVKVDNFSNVAAASLVLNFNPQAMQFVDASFINPALGSNVFINANPSNLNFAWFDLQPLSLANGTNLVTYRFVVNNNASLNWDTLTPGNCEYADLNGDVLSATFQGTTIQVQQGVNITAQPQPQTVANGDTAMFAIQASGVAAFQWQRLVGGSWTNLQDDNIYSGTQSAMLQVVASPMLSGSVYRVKLTGSCGGQEVFSTQANLTVASSTQTITASVGNFTACVNETITVPVEVTNFNDVSAFSLTLAYDTTVLMFSGFSANTAVQNSLIVNAIGTEVRASWFAINPVTIGSATLLNLQFTARVTGQSSLTWDIATQGANEFADFNGDVILANFINGSIDVNAAPPAITQQPVSQTVLEGSSASFTVSATGATNYQWQTLSGSQWVNLTAQAPYSGVDSSTLTITNTPLSLNGAQYRVIVGGLCAPNATSNAVGLQVDPDVNVIEFNLGDFTVCQGSTLSIPVNVANFDNVATFSIRILYDQTQLNYTGLSNVAAPFQVGLASGAINGRLSLSWFSINPANIGTATMFNINFTANGNSTLIWDTVSAGSGTVGDLLGNQYPRFFTNGSVNVNPSPSINFPAFGSLCLTASPINLSASPAGGSFSGTGVSQGMFDPAAAGLGTHTISYTYTDSLGCSNTATRSITVLPTPNGSAGADQTICLGSSATLLASGGSAYLWNTGATTASITVTPTQTTSYWVTISNSSGCSITDTVVVNIYNDPNMSAGPDVNICAGGSIQLQASGALQYFWTPSTGLSATNIANPVASPAVTTTYIVAGLTGSGCVSLDTITVNVNPRPTIDAGADQVVCNGAAVQLQASGGQSYSWAPATGLSATNIANPMANPTVTTVYTVTGTDSLGCTNTDTVVVLVPVLNPGSNRTICRGGSTTMNARVTGLRGATGTSFSWSPATGLSATNIPNPVASPTQTTIYTVTATTASGCVLTGTVAVVVNPTPVVDAGLSLSIAPGSSVNLNASATGGLQPYSISWSPSTGLSSTTVLNPVASPLVTTTYYLTVGGSNGCSETDSITITVDSTLLGKNISGKLVYDNPLLTPLSNGSVVLNFATGANVGSVNVDGAGNFLFQDLSDSSYALSGTTGLAWGGVTSADALIINNYFADPTVLSGLKIDAADVNNDGAINSTDALFTLQRSINAITSFPAGDWVYSQDTLVLAGVDLLQNVRALCVGDVNASYNPGARLSPRMLLAQGPKTGMPARGDVQVPLYVEEAIAIGSFQMELVLQPGDKLLGAKLAGTNEDVLFTQFGNVVRLGWFTRSAALALAADEMLVQLNIRTHGFGSTGLPFEITGLSEATDKHAHLYEQVVLRSPVWTPSVTMAEIGLRNYPNPARDYTTIIYSLPEDGEVKLSIHDMTGRLIDMPVDAFRIGGQHELVWDANALAAGMYFIRLEHHTGNGMATRNERMIIQK